MTRLARPITGIDTHAHIFCRGLPLVEGRRYTPDYDAFPEAYLGRLREAGLSHGVLVQPSFLGADNSYMLAALRRHPEQLRGIATIRPDIGDAELDELDRYGVVGVRLNLVGLPLPDFADEPWASLLRRLAQRNWLVEIHRRAKDLPAILPAILGAGVRVIVDHFGRPDPELGPRDPGFRELLAIAAHGGVWIKLSAPYRNGADDRASTLMATRLRDAAGVEHLLWGSDWPHTQFEQATDFEQVHSCFNYWGLNDRERRAILVDTPAALFRLI